MVRGPAREIKNPVTRACVALACPTCGAWKTQLCHTATRRRAVLVHRPRFRAALTAGLVAITDFRDYYGEEPAPDDLERYAEVEATGTSGSGSVRPEEGS